MQAAQVSLRIADASRVDFSEKFLVFSKILGVWPDAFFTFNENERFFGSDETSLLIRSGALEKSYGAFALLNSCSVFWVMNIYDSAVFGEI